MMNNPVKITPDVLAPANNRFLHYVVDSILCYALTFGIGLGGNYIYRAYGYQGFAMGESYLNNLKFNLMHIVIATMYYGLFESYTARTPGKYFTNSKVVYHDGTFPDAGTIFIRTICRLIPFEIISFLGILPVGWHDRLSKTFVVNTTLFLSKQKQFGNGTNVNGPENNT